MDLKQFVEADEADFHTLARQNLDAILDALFSQHFTNLKALAQGENPSGDIGDLVVGQDVVFPLGGQWLLDPNELNGWGQIGPYDDTNAQDLGNVGANPNRLSGGLCFPWDVELVRMFAWHRNSNGDVQPWGWRLIKQQKTAGSNTVVSTNIIRETGGDLRDYDNNQNQQTDIDFTSNPERSLTAGQVLCLGVEAPTAVSSNRYVQVMSGYLHLRRV